MNWLLLRGLVREAKHWHDFRLKFEKSVPSSQTHCLDLPGIGTQAHCKSPSKVEDIMEDIRTRWIEEKKKQVSGQSSSPTSSSWSILGISLGGMITMAWTAKYPEDFQTMVVINSSAGNLNTPLERFKPASLLHLPTFLFSRDPVRRERALLTLTTGLSSDPVKLEETAKLQASFALPPSKFRQTAIRQMIAGARFKFPESLQHPPALVLIALKDALVDSVCSEKIAKLLKADIRRNPESNHDMAADAPDWIIENVKNWIQGIS